MKTKLVRILAHMSDATPNPNSVQRGQAEAADELLPLVYEELRKLASHKMARLPEGQTLQATALVHEAYLRLVGSGPSHWNNRGHFFSAAAEAMRRILIERARRKGALKRGHGLAHVNLDEVDVATNSDSDLLLLMDEALEEFRKTDPTSAELIKLRFFVGLPNPQAAEVLGISERSAKRSWAYGRAWLYKRIKKQISVESR